MRGSIWRWLNFPFLRYISSPFVIILPWICDLVICRYFYIEIFNLYAFLLQNIVLFVHLVQISTSREHHFHSLRLFGGSGGAIIRAQVLHIVQVIEPISSVVADLT